LFVSLGVQGRDGRLQGEAAGRPGGEGGDNELVGFADELVVPLRAVLLFQPEQTAVRGCAGAATGFVD